MKKGLFEHFLVLLLMCGVAVAASWPLVPHFFAAIPCQTTAGRLFLDRPGDSLQLYYWFWLLRDNLFGPSGFMHNPYEFNMAAGAPPDSLYMYPFYFLYLLFSPLGDIGAFNALVLLSYVFTGLFTYLLAREYTGSRLGALLAALIYTLMPLRIVNLLGGHLNGFILYLLPAILYFLERCIRRKSVLAGILCGLAIFWLSLLEVHLIYYICVFLGGYIPLRILYDAPGQQGETGRWQQAGPEPGCQKTLEPAGGPALAGTDDLLPGSCRRRKWLPLVLLYLAGVGLTCIYQQVVSRIFLQPFFSRDFWVILALYPLLFLLVILLLVDLASRLSGKEMRAWLWFAAVSLAPFALLPISGINHFLHLPARIFLPVFCGGILVLVAWSARFAFQRYLTPWRLSTRILSLKGYGPIIRALLPVGMGLLLAVAWVLLVKKVFFTGSIAHGGRTIQDVKLFSPHLKDLYTRGAGVYIGLVPLYMTVYMLAVVIRQFMHRELLYNRLQLSLATFFSVVFLLASILGAGLSFGYSSLYIPFFNWFPFFNYPRVPDRIMTIAFLAGAILSAFAVRDIVLRFREQRQGVVAVLFSLLLMVLVWYDFGAQKPVALTNLDRGQTIYDYVRKHIGDKLLLELPLWPGDSHQSSLYEYYVTLDRIRRVNGYTPIVKQDYIDRVYKPLATLNRGFLDRDQYELLKNMGVGFITVHDNPDVFPPRVSPYPPLVTVRKLMSSPFLEYVPLRNMIRLPGLELENRRLYLFRVRDRADAISHAEEKATCRYFIPNIYPAAHLSHVTGRLVTDPSIGQEVLEAKKGRDRVHFLNYGPYVELPAGSYEVYFVLRSSDATSARPVVRLEVAAYQAHESQRLVASRVLRGRDFSGKRYQAFTLRFTLDQLQRMEFRTWFYGQADLWLEKIVLTCADDTRFDTLLEAESLLGDTGLPARDSDASGGEAILATLLRDRPGRMVYGPFRKYPAGRYRVRFYLKKGREALSLAPNGEVASLSISTDENKTILASRPVRLHEIEEKQYRPVELTMVLKRDNEVSFNVQFEQKVDMLVDRITIERLSSSYPPAILPILLLRGKNATQPEATGK